MMLGCLHYLTFVMHHPSRPLAYVCLALSMALVGSYVALSKPLAGSSGVLAGVAALWDWRCCHAGLAAQACRRAPMSAQTKRLLFLESFLGNFLFTMCMLYGVSLTSAVSAGVTMAAIPAAVAVMSWAFLRERVPPGRGGRGARRAGNCTAIAIKIRAFSARRSCASGR